jgi:hypothetical protein
MLTGHLYQGDLGGKNFPTRRPAGRRPHQGLITAQPRAKYEKQLAHFTPLNYKTGLPFEESTLSKQQSVVLIATEQALHVTGA